MAPRPAPRLLARSALCFGMLTACSGGGGGTPVAGSTAFPPMPTAGAGGSIGGGAIPALPPLDTSAPDHVIATGGTAAQTTAALQAALARGGVIVFDNVAPLTVVLTEELLLPADGSAVLDGRGTVTLSGGGVRRILAKGWRSSLTVQRLAFVDGRADQHGAAIAVTDWDGDLTVIDCDFVDCRTTAGGPLHGGGAIRANGQTWLQVSGCTFHGCQASNGGAVASYGGRASLVDCTFEACRAFGTGGGQEQGLAGQGGVGGAVLVDGLDLNGTTPQLQLSGCVFRNNLANDQGGAVSARARAGTGSSLVVTGCTFSGNTVSGIGGSVRAAGACYAQEGTLTVTGSTFDHNTSAGVAGAMLVETTAAATLTSCTLCDNRAEGFGGALFAASGTMTLTNVTVAGNRSALAAGGIYRGNAAVTVGNCLFADNLGADPRLGWTTNAVLLDGDHNLQWPVTRGAGGPADTMVTTYAIQQDPLLLPLADNGGPTRTMALPAESPAVDTAGAAFAPLLDQRGLPRQGQPDLGAFERQ